MFRNSKSDEPVANAHPEDDAASKAESPEGSHASVASSALRWLKRAKKPDDTGQNQDDEAEDLINTSRFDLPDIDESDDDDDLELVDLIETKGPGDQDKPSVAKAPEPEELPELEELPPPPTPPRLAPTPKPRQVIEAESIWLFELDDDDDVGDFEDLGDLEAILATPLISTASAALKPAPAKAADMQEEKQAPTARNMSAVDEQASKPEAFAEAKKDQEEGPGGRIDARDKPTLSPPLPLKHRPVADPPKDVPPAVFMPASKLDEAPVTASDTSLALRPIPELQPSAPEMPKQTDSKPLGQEARNDVPSRDDILKSPVVDQPDPDQPDADEDDVLDLDIALDETVTSPTPLTDDVDKDEPDFPKVEIEQLDVDKLLDQEDESADDWHSHLADVLGDAETLKSDRTLKALAPETPTEEPEKPVSTHQQDTPILPLSRPLGELTQNAEPEDDDDDVPLPPLLRETIRRKSETSLPITALAADHVDLSPEQLALGIIANVPRLRRFAAAQIGDEYEADRLVEKTIEAAVANPSSLQTTTDLGLALITLLYRQRQTMLGGIGFLGATNEETRNFQGTLCSGLTGADQFELRQFAQAVTGLDEQDRAFLLLSALENLSYVQIAELTDIPSEQIMKKIAGARQRLRHVLTLDDAGADAPAKAESGSAHAQEIEIHGYLDGELNPNHMPDIDALVEYDSDAADRLLHYGIQGDLIRRLYGPLVNRPIPRPLMDSLSAAVKPTRRGFRFISRKTLRASLFMMAIGGLISSFMSIFWGAFEP